MDGNHARSARCKQSICNQSGDLRGCSIIFATIEETECFIASLQLDMLPIRKEALFLAGKALLSYKKSDGQKANVLPDLLIGAHAAVDGYRLMTRDKGRFSTYFPGVELIIP